MSIHLRLYIHFFEIQFFLFLSVSIVYLIKFVNNLYPDLEATEVDASLKGESKMERVEDLKNKHLFVNLHYCSIFNHKY